MFIFFSHFLSLANFAALRKSFDVGACPLRYCLYFVYVYETPVNRYIQIERINVVT